MCLWPGHPQAATDLDAMSDAEFKSYVDRKMNTLKATSQLAPDVFPKSDMKPFNERHHNGCVEMLTMLLQQGIARDWLNDKGANGKWRAARMKQYGEYCG